MNRRAFVKLSIGAATAGAAWAALPRLARAGEGDPAQGDAPAPYTPTPAPVNPHRFLRPFYGGIPVYEAADIKSKTPKRLKFNEYPAIIAELEGANGNWHNKRWYQIEGGYVFSAHACPTPNELQTPFTTAGDTGFWGEISVPFTDARTAPSAKASRAKYRYLGGCTAKVSKVVPAIDNPDELWYQLEDEMKDLLENYFLSAFKSEEQFQFYSDSYLVNNPVYSSVSEIFEDKNNHVIDALRYACEGARRGSYDIGKML